MKLLSRWQKCGLLVSSVVAEVMLAGCLTPSPQITPMAGAYTCPQTVNITDSSGMASIFYTTDGTVPTTASTKYGGSFALDNSATVRAVAIAPGDTPSRIASSAFTCSTANLTRGQFAMLVEQTFHLSPPTTPIVFPDVPKNSPLYGPVEAVGPYMNAQILCPGCQLKVGFFPDQPILRNISTIALVRILNSTGKLQLLDAGRTQQILSTVSDANTLPASARPYFATAIKNGILTLKAGNTIELGEPHTHAEIVTLLTTIQQQFRGAVPQPQ